MRYSFRDVQVAESRRLWLEAPEAAQVLGLDNRPPPEVVGGGSENSDEVCQDQDNCRVNKASQCCLHVERPEFRRRRKRKMRRRKPEEEDHREEPDCFASCARRRPVDIELAPAGGLERLAGKLVILALSRLQPSPEAEYRCQREPKASWAFQRFEPGRQDGAAGHRDHSGSQLNRTYYALSREPAPLQVDQLNVTWDAGQKRELVSMLVSSPNLSSSATAKAAHHRETLISTELTCRRWLPSSAAAAVAATDEPSSVEQSKIHLLTLVKRQQQQAPGKNATAGLKTSATTFTTAQVVGGVVEASPSSHAPVVAASKPPALKRAIVAATTSTTSLPPVASSPTSLPDLQQQQPAPKTSDLLWNELHGLQSQLQSNGLLQLAVTSILVVIIYSLCLLLHLRCCRRLARGGGGGGGKRRGSAGAKLAGQQQQPPPPPSAVATKTKPADSKQAAADELNISQPFNLQMPPATRTRLRMMMGAGLDGLEPARRKRQANNNSSNKKRLTTTPGAQLPAASSAAHLWQPIHSIQRRPSSAKRMVRAIRRQVSARCRPKTTPWPLPPQSPVTPMNTPGRANYSRPANAEALNVIPESSESSPAPPAELGAAAAAAAGIGTANRKLGKLVRLAMSSHCPHLKPPGEGKTGNNFPRRQPPHLTTTTDTLFSRRPLNHTPASSSHLQKPMSRNRILKQVQTGNPQAEEEEDANMYE